eukprot:2501781-Karenia_brevis.AAC.1
MDAKEKYWTDLPPKNCKGDERFQQYWDKIVAPGAERICRACSGESEEKQFWCSVCGPEYGYQSRDAFSKYAIHNASRQERNLYCQQCASPPCVNP